MNKVKCKNCEIMGYPNLMVEMADNEEYYCKDCHRENTTKKIKKKLNKKYPDYDKILNDYGIIEILHNETLMMKEEILPEKVLKKILKDAKEKNNALAKVILALYRRTNSEDLKELYLKTEKEGIKSLLWGHPNFPKELKIALEL